MSSFRRAVRTQYTLFYLWRFYFSLICMGKNSAHRKLIVGGFMLTLHLRSNRDPHLLTLHNQSQSCSIATSSVQNKCYGSRDNTNTGRSNTPHTRTAHRVATIFLPTNPSRSGKPTPKAGRDKALETTHWRARENRGESKLALRGTPIQHFSSISEQRRQGFPVPVWSTLQRKARAFRS